MSDNTPNSYIAQPPKPLSIKDGSLNLDFLCNKIKSFCSILYQPLVPFHPESTPPQDPPEPSKNLDEKTVDQCRSIYEDAERSRTYLEDKARSTFTFIAFLIPLLISALAFVLKDTTLESWARISSMVIVVLVSALLILGFISIARAVSVKRGQILFLESVIDAKSNDFKKYDAAYYARGLLYCASVNAAMNAHIAQFVKGAQILTTIAVILSCFLAAPLILMASNQTSEPTKTIITEPVNITSEHFKSIENELKSINADLVKASDIRQINFEYTDRLEKLIKLQQQILASFQAHLEAEKTNIKEIKQEKSK